VRIFYLIPKLKQLKVSGGKEEKRPVSQGFIKSGLSRASQPETEIKIQMQIRKLKQKLRQKRIHLRGAGGGGIQTYCTSQLQGFSELFGTFYLARILVLALQGRGQRHPQSVPECARKIFDKNIHHAHRFRSSASATVHVK